ncbi:MAG: asparaginase [Lachnospiraceae bacterium]|nr:asparaginase [Lachnospiraceae bacterium]
MKKILIIATGGTIACVQSKVGLRPELDGEELLKYIPDLKNRYRLDCLQLCNIDSTNMTPEVWGKIVCAVKEHYLAYDGFVICHGTDTLAYTSAALSYMIRNSNKPIVLTGAQKPINLDSTDARTNLSDSIIYAADDGSTGVSVVFGGKVIAGTRAKKTRAHSFNAFSSVNFPALAVIRDGRIIRYIPCKKFQEPVQFTEKVCDSVVVLKLIPGIKPDILEYLFLHYDCLVIESFGVGGIPKNLVDAFYQEMEKWISKGKIVIMATQVVNEGSDMEVYEVGQKIKNDFNLLEAYDMTLEATITKMMYLMEVCKGNYIEIYDGFYKEINYDTVYN